MKVLLIAKQYWAPLFLLLIGIVACAANYTPGTFLSGWDTLHPEFNFSLAFERAFFGVFRPEQGLGAVAGHSHMADLPHIVFLWVSSFVLNPLSSLFNQPQDSLFRYCYIFLCYITGPLGMYLFLSRLLPNKPVAFLGSLFYMLNIGTVQLFYVPFEMFTTQFAILPFLFFFATDFLITYRKRSLLGFSIVTILASPTAFAATLWYVMLLILMSYCITLSIFLKRAGQPKQFVSTLLLFFVFISLNMYWMLPNIYFVLQHGTSVTQAASNQLFSEEAFLYNKAFGNIASVGFLKTFYFNWQILQSGSFVQLFAFWKTYLSWPLTSLSAAFFGCMVLGVGVSIFRRHSILLSFLPGLFVSFIFLLNDNLPFHIYPVLKQIPLFQEAFRFPDDKILGIYVFVYTIFFSVGIATIVKFLKSRKPVFLSGLFFVLVLLSLFLTAFPIFQGQLIHPAMRIVIPQEYFTLFDYLNEQPTGRIATLPVNSLWGWEYYNWHPWGDSEPAGFQGSGFLPFGLKDATMDRDFDRWNPANEAYYRELSYAVYTQNPALFKQTLQKYDISYVLIDTSIAAPGSSPQSLFYQQLQKLLQDSNIHLTAQFHNHLFVYQNQPHAVIALTKTLPEKPGTLASFFDSSYLTSGNYQTAGIADTTDNLARVYPTIDIQTAGTTFTKNLYPNLVVSPQVNTCTSENFAKSDTTKAVIKTLNPFIEYVSDNGQYCDHINITTRKPNIPFLIHIQNRNLSGLSLRLCVIDPSTDRCIIETKLPASRTFQQATFLVPPLPTTKLSINFANIGIAPTTTINDIAGISIQELPAKSITTNPSTALPQAVPAIISQNNTYYKVQPTPTNMTLLLSQSYEPGWQMYAISKQTPRFFSQTVPFLVGKPIGQHILVDSWKNGWILPATPTSHELVIVFLPQYLEYGGFGIGIVTLCILLIGMLRAKAIPFPFSRRTK